jgi:iron-sulfur cluster assembly protein
VIEEMHKELLSGTVIDFVELEPGDFHFIFMNPNDANYTPPVE